MWVDNTGGLYGGVQAALLEGLQSRESAEKQTSQGVSQQQAQPQKVQLKQSHQGQGTPQQQQQQQQLQLQQSQQPAPVIPRPPQRAIPQQPKAKQLKLSQQQQSTTQHMKTSHPSQLQQQQQQQQSQSARTSPRVLAHGSQPEGVKPRTKKTLVQKKEYVKLEYSIDSKFHVGITEGLGHHNQEGSCDITQDLQLASQQKILPRYWMKLRKPILMCNPENHLPVRISLNWP